MLCVTDRRVLLKSPQHLLNGPAPSHGQSQSAEIPVGAAHLTSSIRPVLSCIQALLALAAPAWPLVMIICARMISNSALFLCHHNIASLFIVNCNRDSASRLKIGLESWNR